MARVWHATGGRQSGRTTRAMQEAPKGAVYVWVHSNLDYPKELARKLGREDLRIVSPAWLEDRVWVGSLFSGIRLDHAATLSSRQWDAYFEVRDLRCRSPEPQEGKP